MKRLLITVTVLGLVLADYAGTASAQSDNQQGPPGLQNKGGVPPGLQKKGGVPPGQAKKAKKGESGKSDGEEQEQATPSEAKPTSPKPAVQEKAPEPQNQTGASQSKPAAPPVPAEAKAPSPTQPAGSPTPQVAKDSSPTQPTQPAKTATPEKKVSREVQAQRDRLHRQLADLNSLTTTPEVRQRVLSHISDRRRIPMATLEAQLKAHPGAGVGDLYVAHVIARKVNKPVEDILAENKSGRSWGELVNTYRVQMDDLQANTATLREMAQRTAKKTTAQK